MNKSEKLTAAGFIEKLNRHQSDEELKKIRRYFKTGSGEYAEGDQFMGVKMGRVFALAKEHEKMPIEEIETLLESPVHEIRAGGVSIMDKASRKKKTSESRIKDFFDLYIRRHDRINNWDLVDLGCLYMTGRHLFNNPRNILYRLAESENLWERRSAIISTCYFIRNKDIDDTYRISEILMTDNEELVQKAAGWMLRTAGPADPARQLKFLDQYAPEMPRTMLRAAIEKLDKDQRKYYREFKTD